MIGVIVAFCGCATQALWEDEAFDGVNKPARRANVEVAKFERDWLIQYDEVNEKSARVRRRAYILYANDERVRGHKRPDFVTGIVAAGGEARAVVSDNAPEFTLYDGDAVVGTYTLPVYPAPSGRVKQILLTPLTVAVDVTIVGAVLVGYVWLHSDHSCPD